MVAIGYPNPWALDYASQTTGNGIQQGYHKFPCSKCHTPHASRLKRLMRTNCLDNGASVKAGDGFDDYQNDYFLNTITGNHTPQGTIAYDYLVTNQNLNNFDAANCHSVAGSSSGGWNSITPW
jgi:hypothetical protein